MRRNPPSTRTAGRRFPLKGFPVCQKMTIAASWMLAILLLSFVINNHSAKACPFCESVQQTIRQQSETMDAVVIASSLDGELTRNLSTGGVKMKIEVVLKGGDLVKVGETVDAVYYGKVEVGRRFLLSGVDPPKIQWSCLPVTERTEKYIVESSKIKDDALARLQYYRAYLEDEDQLISRDAYDEFASTGYEDLKKIGPEMDRKQLIAWAKEPEIGADRKRLYFTLLGICGTKADLPMLESMLRNPAKSVTGGLDALIACYLTLAGEDGLPLVNELFIANKKAPFPQSYAAIMAVRFHGTEGGVIPRSALSESFHKVLDRSELADMVIPDLARWKDWSQIDRLKRLFIEAEKDKNWLRVPVINYLRACPLEKAEQAIDELEKVDPDAVRRAKTFFPIPVPVRSKPGDGASWSPSLSPKKTASRKTMSGKGKLPALEALQPSQTSEQTVAGASKLRVGTKYAAISGGLPLLQTGQNQSKTSVNSWNLGYVLTMALLTIILGQFLVLTGGSPTGGSVIGVSNTGKAS